MENINSAMGQGNDCSMVVETRQGTCHTLPASFLRLF